MEELERNMIEYIKGNTPKNANENLFSYNLGVEDTIKFIKDIMKSNPRHTATLLALIPHLEKLKVDPQKDDAGGGGGL